MLEFFLGITVICLLLSVVFSASEASIFSLSHIELAGLQSLGLKERYLEMLKKPEELLFAILTGNELADYFASFSFATAISFLFSETLRPYAFIFFAISSFFLGDFFPKLIGFKLRSKLVLKIIPLTYFLYKILFPLRYPLYLIYLKILKIFPEFKSENSYSSFTPVEQIILHTLERAYKEGKITLTEREFIYGLFLSEKIPVSAIMTPRSEIVAFKDQPFSLEIMERIKNLPYNKIPIYKNTLDEVIGILYAKDLFKYFAKKEELTQKRLSELTRPIYFVPESFKVRELLFEFQRRHQKIALVVDEYGMLKGLVTLEDVLEELFGEVHGEKEELEEPIVKTQEGFYLLSGKALLEEVREVLNFTLEEELLEDLKTVNGLMLYLFQGIPKDGEKISFQGIEFTILKTRGRKVILVSARPLSQV